MKKLILLLLPLWCSAQTTITRTVQPNLDTLQTTTTVSSVTLKYKPPVTPPSTNPGGLKSNPVTYSNLNGTVISGLSFDGGGASKDLITLNNCQNVHITMCRFSNTNGISVRLINCQNTTVDYCFFTMVNFGVFATGSTGTKVNFNQGLNLWAPVKYNGNFAHWVQFYNCPASAGQQVNDNIFISQDNVAVHPHDAISLDAVSGVAGSPIQIYRNKIKGGMINGGWPNTGDTGVGITAPDVLGNYYDIKNNIVVNSGVNGMLVIATGSNINLDGNIIVNDNKNVKVSYDGFTISGSHSNMTVSNTRVRWLRPNGTYLGNWFGGGSTYPGVTFTNNNWNDTSLTSAIIQDSAITYK